MLLPSDVRVVRNTPIYAGSFFSWGEATKNCSRPPADLIIDERLLISAGEVEAKIKDTAAKLDRIRDILGGRPLIINSWYRPRHINTRVGGSKFSRHQYGDGVDFRSDYLRPQEIYSLLNRIHFTGGLAFYPTFVHIDWRGTKARW